MQTLEEFDWCLKKLESVNSASMGTMAQDKFRRILSRELSHMTGKSRAGDHVAEWVQNITNPGQWGRIINLLVVAVHAAQCVHVGVLHVIIMYSCRGFKEHPMMK